MNYSVFDEGDYKKYALRKLRDEGRGARSRLSKVARCHLAYISQVLEGNAHFTLEQAMAVNSYFGHPIDEADYFLLLVHRARAGTQELKDYYSAKIQNIVDRRMQIRSRIKAKHTLTLEEEVRYYSSWQYVALFVLISIPQFQTKDALARRLGLSRERISECLEYLVSIGIVKESKGRYALGETRIHLPAQSPLISKHHTNWRMKAITALDQPRPENLHFSTAYSLSRSDVAKIRAMLLKFVEEADPVIMASPEEVAYCLAFDFFEI